MDYVVTGAAGFIGSNLVEGAERARRDATSSRSTTSSSADKFANLVDCEIADYLDKERIPERARGRRFDGEVEAVLHQGACSDTMETDGRYMMENNYRYSRRAARLVPGAGGAVHLRVVGLGLRRRARVPRGARIERRSTSTATRSSCSTSTCAGARRGGPRRSRASATSTSTARTRRTRGAWPRSPSISSTSIARRAR